MVVNEFAKVGFTVLRAAAEETAEEAAPKVGQKVLKAITNKYVRGIAAEVAGTGIGEKLNRKLDKRADEKVDLTSMNDDEKHNHSLKKKLRGAFVNGSFVGIFASGMDMAAKAVSK